MTNHTDTDTPYFIWTCGPRLDNAIQHTVDTVLELASTTQSLLGPPDKFISHTGSHNGIRFILLAKTDTGEKMLGIHSIMVPFFVS
jgi:hypothetical protein